MKKLFLIDAYSTIYISYYSYISNPIYNSKGENISALYGFISTIIKLINKFDVENLAVCFDCGKSEYRTEMYDDYKANREPMPDDLKNQISMIKELLTFMGIKYVEMAGFEADDIMAYLSNNNQDETYILTRDKDLYQLIDDKTKIIKIEYGDFVVFDSDGVFMKYGFSPKRIVDYLSLVGDSADNIKGVMGVGPKNATRLILDFGSLDWIYKNIESIKGAIKTKLIEGKKDAYFSKKLVELNLDVPIDTDIDSYKFNGIDKEKLTVELKNKEIGLLSELLT